VEQFDDLENYVNCWPIDDLLKSRLKSTSARWRREQRLKEGDLVKERAERLKAKVKKAKKSKVCYIFIPYTQPLISRYRCRTNSAACPTLPIISVFIFYVTLY
jgi:hypothetical protein